MLSGIVRTWNELSSWRKILSVALIALLPFVIWALAPLFYNRQVNEAFPAAAPIPTAMAESGAMAKPTAIAESGAMTKPTTMAQSGAMAKPTAMAESGAMAEPTAMADHMSEPMALLQGDLVSGSTPGHHTSGTATIYQLENKSQVLRLQDFSTTNGPDLFVVLSANTNPDADGIGAEGSYLQLAALKGNKGNQNYDVPAATDGKSYKSVVIWCRTFNVVFGYATLQQAT
ncbi:MAG: DM13 domain-containing protein [Kouleothrix sp.]